MGLNERAATLRPRPEDAVTKCDYVIYNRFSAVP